jgi:hypothetical protein
MGARFCVNENETGEAYNHIRLESGLVRRRGKRTTIGLTEDAYVLV